MARYNTFKYGGAKYGTTPTTTILLWTCIVDWDGDGYYTGENEAAVMMDLSVTRGRDHFIVPSGVGFEAYKAGRATVILDNDDGRYNPYNTSSPLYPNVTPGKSVRLGVKNGNLGENYSLMRGKIDDIQPFARGKRQLVRLEIVDGQEFLRGRTVKLGEDHNEGPAEGDFWTSGKWVDRILDHVNWPTPEWGWDYDWQDDINDGIYHELPYAWFWLRDAMISVRELEVAEGTGMFLHARDGFAKFLASDFTQNKLVVLDESELLYDISLPQPWETLRNQIQVRVHQTLFHDLNLTFWLIGGDGDVAISVLAGATFVTDAEFKYFNYRIVPANEAIVFDFSSVSSGAPLNDLDGDVVVSFKDGEVADGATIIFQNTGGTDGFIRELSVFGDAIYSKYQNWVISEDTISEDAYGSRVFKLDSPWVQESDWAKTMADNLLAALKDPTPYPVIKLEDRPDKQFGLDLFLDKVQFNSSTLEISRLFRIGKITHRWNQETGVSCTTTVKLEPDLALGAPTQAVYSDFWDFETGADSWALGAAWDAFNFSLRADCSGGAANEALCPSPYLETVVAGSFIMFMYRWSFQQDAADAEILFSVNYDVAPTTFITIPIIASQEYIPYFYPIPAARIGDDIIRVGFTKTNVPLDGFFYLGELGVGVLS